MNLEGKKLRKSINPECEDFDGYYFSIDHSKV
jgi:hypothetical protein